MAALGVVPASRVAMDTSSLLIAFGPPLTFKAPAPKLITSDEFNCDYISKATPMSDWIVFIRVTNWYVSFSFPMPLCPWMKVQETIPKDCLIFNCLNFESHASQVGLNTKRLKILHRKQNTNQINKGGHFQPMSSSIIIEAVSSLINLLERVLSLQTLFKDKINTETLYTQSKHSDVCCF